jgi:hypothetical protein
MDPFTVFNCRCIPILPTEETKVAEKSVYKPSREGAKEIPLSFTGRHLLQSLREAVTDALSGAHERGTKHLPHDPNKWIPISRARERIAQYMSDLEKKAGEFFLREVPFNDLALELGRRGYTVDKKLPPWHRRPASDSINELLDAGFTVSVTHDYRRPPDKSYAVRVDGVVSSDQAQRIGQHMMERDQRNVERNNQKINFENVQARGRGLRVPLAPGLYGFVIEPMGLEFDYIARPKPPHQYLKERVFKAAGAAEARKIAREIYAKDGYRDFEFDLFVKTRD